MQKFENWEVIRNHPVGIDLNHLILYTIQPVNY